MGKMGQGCPNHYSKEFSDLRENGEELGIDRFFSGTFKRNLRASESMTVGILRLRGARFAYPAPLRMTLPVG